MVQTQNNIPIYDYIIKKVYLQKKHFKPKLRKDLEGLEGLKVERCAVRHFVVGRFTVGIVGRVGRVGRVKRVGRVRRVGRVVLKALLKRTGSCAFIEKYAILK